MDTLNKHGGLTGAALKWIALVTMLIDHTGAAVLYRWMLHHTYGQNVVTLYLAIRLIGRVAFPIYCYLLVEGFFHTRSRLKYALRLGLFALLSEFPFDYALHHVPDWGYQNVFLTLLLGLLTIWALEELRLRFSPAAPADSVTPAAADAPAEASPAAAPLQRRALLFLGRLAVIAFFCCLAKLLSCDYSYAGILTIVIIYRSFNRPAWQSFALACLLLGLLNRLELAAFVGILPMWFYSGERGKQPKYLFYAFYPAHLLILGLICALMGV